MPMDSSGEDSIPVPAVIPRSPDTLRLLPPELRWEFTRRNPQYLVSWRLARKFKEAPSSDPFEAVAERFAAFVLTQIGVTGLPPDPSTPFEKLDDDPLSQAWKNGAISPQSYRSLCTVFLGLPPKNQREIGELLIDASRHSGERTLEFLNRIIQFEDEIFNSVPNLALIAIQPTAPSRAIVEAVEAYVRELKVKLSLPERRRRDDAYPDYLAVWDLREGWIQGTYDCSRELSLTQVAKKLEIPIGTARNRYRSAFRYISGHEFCDELWVELVGKPKIREAFGPITSTSNAVNRSTKAPRRSKAARLPSSTANPAETSADSLQLSEDDVALAHEILKRIVRGENNETIKQALKFKTELADELVEYFRVRVSDKL